MALKDVWSLPHGLLCGPAWRGCNANRTFTNDSTNSIQHSVAQQLVWSVLSWWLEIFRLGSKLVWSFSESREINCDHLPCVTYCVTQDVYKTSLLRRLRPQTLPNEAPPIGKIHPFCKIAVIFEPVMWFGCPPGFRIAISSLNFCLCCWRSRWEGKRHQTFHQFFSILFRFLSDGEGSQKERRYLLFQPDGWWWRIDGAFNVLGHKNLQQCQNSCIIFLVIFSCWKRGWKGKKDFLLFIMEKVEFFLLI